MLATQVQTWIGLRFHWMLGAVIYHPAFTCLGHHFCGITYCPGFSVTCLDASLMIDFSLDAWFCKLTWPKWSSELLPPWSVRRPSLLSSLSLTFHILISSETTGPVWTKLGRDSPWVVPFQNYIRRPRPPTKMATMAKNRKSNKKIIKNLLLWNYLANWDQTWVEWSLGGPLSELYPTTPPPTKMAAISWHSFNIEPYGKNV